MRVLLALLMALVGLFGMGWLGSELALSARFDVTPRQVPVTVDGSKVRHGQHLVEVVLACGHCHGEDLGGAQVPGVSWWAPNLTDGEGGVGPDYAVEDWVRAITYGVAPDGRGLRFMPAQRWSNLTDGDLSDVVAYLQQVPPIDRPSRPVQLGWWERAQIAVLGGAVEAHDLQDGVMPSAVQRAPDARFGAYLAQTAGCTDCHGADLQGGRGLGMSGPALDGVAEGTGAHFITSLVDEPAHPLGTDGVAAYEGFEDLERDALWAFVRETSQ